MAKPAEKLAFGGITLEVPDALVDLVQAFLQDVVLGCRRNILLTDPKLEQWRVDQHEVVPTLLRELLQVEDHAGTRCPLGLGLRRQFGMFAWFHC